MRNITISFSAAFKKFIMLVMIAVTAIFQLEAQTYSFTSCGATGSNGPTQSQVNLAYASSSITGVVSNNGIQEWTVPATGLYSIKVAGAKGGGAGGGNGAVLSGEFMLTQGHVIQIVVGQRGTGGFGSQGSLNSGGGGGGSFVVNKTTNTILLIAGGGGGGNGDYGSSYPNTAGNPASTGTSGNSTYQTGGGTNGNGGKNGVTDDPAAGGGGYLTNGENSPGTTFAGGGQAFINGARGGAGRTGTYFGGNGGFGGGGGGTSNVLVRGGGGGGYSGGQGGTYQIVQTSIYTSSSDRGHGAGAGSINNGTNPLTYVTNAAVGYVTVTTLSTPAGALNFVKSNNTYITVPHSSSMNLGAEFTIESWVNYTGVNSTIIDKGDYDYLLQVNCNNPGFAPNRLNFYNRNTGWVHSTGTVPEGVWTHVAVTLKNGTMTFYINGVASGTAAVNYAQDNGPVNIGRQSPSSCACNIFNGNMDELRVWNRALSACEISSNKNCELSGAQTGLAAYYKFNQGSVNTNNSAVNTLTDASGNNNTGTLTNFALTGTTSNWVAGQVSGTCGPIATPVPTINASGSTTICAGGSVTLTASAGSSYLWSNGATNQSITVSTAGAYTVTVTNASGCSGTSAATNVTVTTINDQTVTATPVNICGTGSSTVTLASSQIGVYYTLRNNANNAVVAGPIAGTGAAINFNTGNIAATTTYNVLAETKPTGALSLNGTTYVTIPHAANLNVSAGGQLTMEAWVNPAVSGQWRNILMKGAYGYGMAIDASNRLYFWDQGAGNAYNTWSDVTVPANSWSHVAITVQDNGSNLSVKLYLNGVNVGNKTSPIAQINDNTESLILGRQGTGCGCNYFNGKLDDVRIWNTVRSEAEILAGMNSCLSGSETGLTALFKMDDGSGTTVLNSKPGSNGTITGTASWTTGNVVCGAVCSLQMSATPTVTVQPLPTVNPVTNIEVCHNSGTVPVINFTGSVEGATYSWTNDNPSIGLAASGSGNIASFTALNPGNEPVYANITVTPSYSVDENTCTGTPVSFVIRVNPIPVFNAIANQSLCNGAQSTAINLTSAVSGTTFTWFNTTPSVNIGLPNGNGATIPSFTAVNNTGEPVTATYLVLSYYQGGTMGCGTSRQVSYTVNPIPEATITTSGSTAICAGGSVTLTASTGVSYLWSNGATTASIVVTEAGNYSVTVTGAGGCVATSAPVTVTTYAMPTISCSGNISVVSVANQCGANVTYPDAIVTAGPANPTITYSHPSGSFFPVGNTIVTATVTDACGNTATCTFEVTVADNILPLITAPASITVNAGSNCTAASVTLGNPVTSDNCAVQSVTNNAPAVFPIGNTTVTWTVTDASGNTAQATQTVTVKDGTAPVPVLASLPNITAECNVTVTIIPTATDNCSGTINATTTSPLTYNSQGTYTITWKYTDAAGNSSTQTQTVVVQDITPPVVTCPAPITVTAPSNQCGAVVTFNQPTVTDNCSSGNTGVHTLASGAQFFDYADNRMENQYSPGLPMSFFPTDGQKLAVFLVNCGSTHYMYQNITLPSSGPINLGLDMKYTNHYASGFSTNQFIAIELRNPTTNAIIATLFKTNPGAPQSTPMTHYNFDLSAYAGQQVRLQVVDATINNFFLDVQLDNITVPGSSLVNGSFETGNYSGWTVGSASATCGTFGIGSGPSVSIVQKAGLPSGSTFPIGTTINTFEVTDLAGNKTTCSFNVTVNAPEINISGNGTPISSGDNTPSGTDHTDLGGTIPGNSISKTFVIANNGTSALTVSSININNAAFTRSGISLPATIQPGQTASFTVSFASTVLGVQTAVVTVNNNDCNEGSYSFTVKAEVTCTNPVFVNFNAQVQANTTATTCNAVVNYPLAVTGIPAPALSYSFSGATTGNGVGTGSGQTFNQGTTHVVVTAVNPCSTVLAEFDVIVTDITPPVAIAQNLDINLDANGAAGITAAQINNGSTDNCGIASISVNKTSFDCSNVGVNTVILTVTDLNGNVSTAPATVTVVDAIAPSITAPAAISQGTDAGVCGATVNLGIPVTADNCSVASVTNDAPTLFPVGTTVVTWTVKDANGNSNTATQTVVIADTEKPKITAPALVSVVNIPGSCMASVDLGTPITSDNCGVATVMNNAPALFPVGSTIVRWIVTDIHGNITDTATQEVVVIDNEKPSISINNISVNNDAGKCGATVVISLTETADNCGVATVMGERSDNKLLTEDYPVGTTTITWTVRDVNGNIKTATQTIVVTDNEKPVIVCAANQVFCANTGGNTQYAIPVLNQSDNCGIASTTYSITGATNRTGTCTNASGSFAIGTSTVTFTVTDIHGNVSTCSFTVTVNPLPVASITAATADALCNQFTLTANSTLSGPFTYQWLYNNNTKATTQQLGLGLTDADGVYSVYTTDANGCRSEMPATYNYQKQTLVSSYTILGMKEVKLGQYNKVETGSVGVMSSRGEAEFDKYSAVTGAGSFVKAPRIDTDKGVTINSKIYGVAGVTLPTMQYNTSSTRYLQDKTINSNLTTTVTGNYDDITLKKGSNVTLTGTIFGKIKLEEGASVRFTSTTIDVEEIQIEKGPKTGGYSYIRFAPNTSIRVSKKVTIGSDVIVNPEAYQVTFYMADNRRDEEKFHVKGDDTRITANIILPDGKLKITGGNYGDDKCDHKPHSSNSCRHRGHGHHDCDHRGHGDRDCRDDVFMTGLFIAEEVESEGKNVIWNSYNCAAPSAPVTAVTSNNNKASVTEEAASAKTQATSRSEEELKVTVMPNPSRTYFTLKLESKYEAPVTLRVVDASGRVIDSRAKIGSNSTIQIGHNYHAGNYFAELVQGNRRKVIQLIKVQ